MYYYHPWESAKLKVANIYGTGAIDSVCIFPNSTRKFIVEEYIIYNWSEKVSTELMLKL